MDAQIALRAVNQKLGDSLGEVLAGLDDVQIQYGAPAIDARSIAQVAIHIYDGVLGFTSAVAGVAWPAEPAAPGTATELRALLDALRVQVDALLAGLPEGALEREVTLPWGETLRGLEAIAGSLAHGFVHVGSIGGMRAIGGFPTPPEPW